MKEGGGGGGGRGLRYREFTLTFFSQIPCLQEVWDLNAVRVSRSLDGRRAIPIGEGLVGLLV